MSNLNTTTKLIIASVTLVAAWLLFFGGEPGETSSAPPAVPATAVTPTTVAPTTSTATSSVETSTPSTTVFVPSPGDEVFSHDTHEFEGWVFADEWSLYLSEANNPLDDASYEVTITNWSSLSNTDLPLADARIVVSSAQRLFDASQTGEGLEEFPGLFIDPGLQGKELVAIISARHPNLESYAFGSALVRDVTGSHTIIDYLWANQNGSWSFELCFVAGDCTPSTPF